MDLKVLGEKEITWILQTKILKMMKRHSILEMISPAKKERIAQLICPLLKMSRKSRINMGTLIILRIATRMALVTAMAILMVGKRQSILVAKIRKRILPTFIPMKF